MRINAATVKVAALALAIGSIPTEALAQRGRGRGEGGSGQRNENRGSGNQNSGERRSRETGAQRGGPGNENRNRAGRNEGQRRQPEGGSFQPRGGRPNRESAPRGTGGLERRPRESAPRTAGGPEPRPRQFGNEGQRQRNQPGPGERGAQFNRGGQENRRGSSPGYGTYSERGGRNSYERSSPQRNFNQRNSWERSGSRGSSYNRGGSYSNGYRGSYYAPRRIFRGYSNRPRYYGSGGRLSIYFGIGSGYRFGSPYSGRVYGRRVAVYGVQQYYGDVRLKVSPREASVYVDGYYAGIVDDFDGFFQRLTLEAGPHEIEIEAPGLEPQVFDVYVDPTRTIDLHADLRIAGEPYDEY
jgi:hypothetical protein